MTQFFNKENYNIVNNNQTTYISLGSYCLTSMLLKENNMKNESYPFDWIVSCIENINHILNDNFKEYMNINNYLTIKNKTKNNYYFKNTLNMFPDILYDIQHHNLLNKQDYDYFNRCIQRFKTLNERFHKKVFIMIQPLYLTNKQIDYNMINNLFSYLKRHFSNMKLIIFNILKKHNKVFKSTILEENLLIVELDTKMVVGNYGMMYFDKDGIKKFLEIISE